MLPIARMQLMIEDSDISSAKEWLKNGLTKLGFVAKTAAGYEYFMAHQGAGAVRHDVARVENTAPLAPPALCTSANHTAYLLTEQAPAMSQINRRSSFAQAMPGPRGSLCFVLRSDSNADLNAPSSARTPSP